MKNESPKEPGSPEEWADEVHCTRVEERFRWYRDEFGRDRYDEMVQWMLEQGDFPGLKKITSEKDRVRDIVDVILPDRVKQQAVSEILGVPVEIFFQQEQMPRAQFLGRVYEYRRGQIPDGLKDL